MGRPEYLPANTAMTRYKWYTLIFTLLAFIAFSPPIDGQSGRFADEEVTLKVGYRHADANLETPTSPSQFSLADKRNSVCAGGGYTHYLGREKGRGNLGIGFDGSACFSNTEGASDDGGIVTIGRFQYKMVYMDNRPDKLHRFGVKGTTGAAREQFKNRAVQGAGGTVIASRGANAWTYGGGVIYQIGRDRRRFQIELEYYRSFYLKQLAAFPNRKDKHNFEVWLGFVF